MIHKLPFELIALIADYLPIRDASVFASTCRRCYFASLPRMWHHISLNNIGDLSAIIKRLESNTIQSQHAIKFVKDVSIRSSTKRELSSPSFMIMLGVVRNDLRQQGIESMRDIKGNNREHISVFAQRLLDLFPHLSSLVVDYSQAAKTFSDVDDDSDNATIPFSGSLSLVNYKADNTHFMHSILSPFNEAHQLTVEAPPIRSLCDDVDESILTNRDIENLSTLGLSHLTRLELSYLDSNINLDAFSSLLKSIPHIHDLYLKWIFPPKKDAYRMLCECIQYHSSLYPKVLDSKPYTMYVHFVLVDSTQT